MIERQITRGTKIVLQPENASVDLTQPFFAINWFNTRAMWLYNLYNLIAAHRVFNVDARIFLKGRVTRTLLGSPEAERQVLLIVNYPSGESFLDLLADRFFQVSSVLRMIAVRDFSFVLNVREDGPALLEGRTQEFQPDRAWAVHHYSSSRDLNEELAIIRNLSNAGGIELRFLSQRGASVHTVNRIGQSTELSSVTDRVVILEADCSQTIESAVQGSYSEFLAGVDTSYLGLFRRTA